MKIAPVNYSNQRTQKSNNQQNFGMISDNLAKPAKRLSANIIERLTPEAKDSIVNFAMQSLRKYDLPEFCVPIIHFLQKVPGLRLTKVMREAYIQPSLEILPQSLRQSGGKGYTFPEEVLKELANIYETSQSHDETAQRIFKYATSFKHQ